MPAQSTVIAPSILSADFADLGKEIRAIDEAGAKDRVLVVAFDNAVKELSYLEEGVIKATVVQRPYNMGYLSIKTAKDYLHGEKVVPFIDTGSVLITKENMFEREYQELLFPFSTEP